MERILRIFLVMLVIVSCNESKQKTIKENKSSQDKIENETILKTPKSEVETSPNTEIDIWEIPNSETLIELVKTVDKKDNTALFSMLTTDLNREHFKIESTELNSRTSYYDCRRNVILSIEGKGTRKYYIKRQQAKPKGYYPDFILWVFEFENEESAKRVENSINSAFTSGGRFCNGKEPKFVTRNGNEIFQLSTRAEMFRGYINHFGEKIKNHR